MIIRQEQFDIGQTERLGELSARVPEWLKELKDGQLLIVGIPEVGGAWGDTIPLVMPNSFEREFLEWLQRNESDVRGPTSSQPLATGFQLIAIAEPFNDCELPDDAGEALIGTMNAFRRWWLTQALASAL